MDSLFDLHSDTLSSVKKQLPIRQRDSKLMLDLVAGQSHTK